MEKKQCKSKCFKQTERNFNMLFSFNDLTLLTPGLDQVLPRNAAVAFNQTVAKSEGNMWVAIQISVRNMKHEETYDRI